MANTFETAIDGAESGQLHDACVGCMGYGVELLKLSVASFSTCRLLQIALLRRLLRMKLGILVSRFMVDYSYQRGQVMPVEEFQVGAPS